MTTRWEVFARTDVGRTRERNEDNYLVACSHNSDKEKIGSIGSEQEDLVKDGEGPSGLLVVADGMGGHANGNIAALAAVESLKDWYRTRHPLDGETERDLVEGQEIRDLSLAISQANIDIFRRNRGAFSIEGMGTTVVALLLFHRYVVTAWVGDSRIYVYRDDKLQQVTKDHSLIEELIRYNIIGEQDVFLNPNKNIITRALGMNETVEVDAQVEEVQDNDLWLLCSDGLTDMVEDKCIEEVIREVGAEVGLAELTNRLVDLANERGGIDNITVVLGRCSCPPESGEEESSESDETNAPADGEATEGEDSDTDSEDSEHAEGDSKATDGDSEASEDDSEKTEETVAEE